VAEKKGTVTNRSDLLSSSGVRMELLKTVPKTLFVIPAQAGNQE